METGCRWNFLGDEEEPSRAKHGLTIQPGAAIARNNERGLA
jgi:hypothetical protein